MQQLSLILEQLKEIHVDTENMSEAELQVTRKTLNNIDSVCGAIMGETSTKDHNYNDVMVKEYIEDILEDGFNLNSTELSDCPELVDAQRLRKWSDLIAACVEHSEFGAKKFKIHSLRLLRSNIAQAKTLHDLRKAVNLMISPLELWRDHKATCEKYSVKNLAQNDKEIDKFVDKLLLENEELKSVCAERSRVLNEIIGCYDEGLSDVSLLRNCEAAKKANNLSDEEAARVFGISRLKLNRLRKSVEVFPEVVQKFVQPTEAYWEALRKDNERIVRESNIEIEKRQAVKPIVEIYTEEQVVEIGVDPMRDYWKNSGKTKPS